MTTSPDFGRATGLVCRECGAEYSLGAAYACAECFGPLEVRYDFTGRLAHSWPATPTQARLNRGDVGYDPLGRVGRGGRPQVGHVVEQRGVLLMPDRGHHRGPAGRDRAQ